MNLRATVAALQPTSVTALHVHKLLFVQSGFRAIALLRSLHIRSTSVQARNHNIWQGMRVQAV